MDILIYLLGKQHAVNVMINHKFYQIIELIALMNVNKDNQLNMKKLWI